MKFSTLFILAASFIPAFAAVGEGEDWVTYTKHIADENRDITVTRYMGTSTFLSGTEFHTRTIIVSKDGKAAYTEVITGFDVPGATVTTTATPELNEGEYPPGQGPDWVTYTKHIAAENRDITVTRYMGTSTHLEGPAYTTKTVVISKDGKPRYTEIITGHNDAIDGSKPTGAPVYEHPANEKEDKEQSTSSSTDTEESSQEKSTTTSGSSFALFGYVIGVIAVGSGAYMYFRKPKAFVELGQQA